MVLPPDINESKTYFSTKNGQIRFGLAAVKGIGLGVIDNIIKEREENGKFTSLEDFCLRCTKDLNTRLVENLIYAGAFDCTGKNRRQMILSYGEILEKANLIKKQNEANQFNIFEIFGAEMQKIDVEYPLVKEFSLKEKLSYEKQVAGVYITGHPLEQYYSILSSMPNNTEDFLVFREEAEESEEGQEIQSALSDGSFVQLGGIVTSVKKLMTKNGSYMAIVGIEDLYGEIECVLFPKSYDKYFQELEIDSIVTLKGRLQLRDGKPPSVSIEHLNFLNTQEESEEIENKKTQFMGLIISEENEKRLEEIYDILGFYPGEIQVAVKIKGKNHRTRYSIRNCRGLINELTSILSDDEIKFFEV